MRGRALRQNWPHCIRAPRPRPPRRFRARRRARRRAAPTAPAAARARPSTTARRTRARRRAERRNSRLEGRAIVAGAAAHADRAALVGEVAASRRRARGARTRTNLRAQDGRGTAAMRKRCDLGGADACALGGRLGEQPARDAGTVPQRGDSSAAHFWAPAASASHSSAAPTSHDPGASAAHNADKRRAARPGGLGIVRAGLALAAARPTRGQIATCGEVASREREVPRRAPGPYPAPQRRGRWPARGVRRGCGPALGTLGGRRRRGCGRAGRAAAGPRRRAGPRAPGPRPPGTTGATYRAKS